MTITAIARTPWGRRSIRMRSRRRNPDRAVSDVVGTILLLALTVTLFASIFFFVNTFPRPPTQPSDQFQAQLVYGGALSQSILGVRITHLAGPTLSGHNVLFYLQSAAHPTRFTAPYDLGAGLNGTYVWNLGQTWSVNITNKTLSVPDNLTVSIVTPTSLLFRVTLPGNNPNLPPEFANSGTIPVEPGIGQGFTVYVQIVDNTLNTHSVYINVSQVPGLGSVKAAAMTPPGSSGLWTYSVPNSATTTAGTYYVFVNASDSKGLPNSIAIPVTISSSTVTQANVALSTNPSAPVIGSSTTLTATVTNPGSSSGAVTVTFTAAGVNVGMTTGSLGGGATGSFSTTWTPGTPGNYLLGAIANVTGGGSVSGTLNITVWPKIEFVAHNVLSGTSLKNNTTALLAGELTAAGVPFTSTFVPCTTGLPTSGSTNIGAFNITIIDFGSSNGGSCVSAPSSTEIAKITSASSTNFWIVGATAFAATACNSYTAAYFALFNLKFTAGSTCVTLGSASSAATWSSTIASGFRADGGSGWTSTLAINQTLQGSSSYRPYDYFPLGVTTGSSAFLKAGGNVVGSWYTTGAHRNVALATAPSLLVDNLPTAQAWGAGEPGTAAVYNIINYMAGFASSTSPGRALLDFGVSGGVIVGVNHASPTTVYASVRANGAVGGVVTVQLLVNGSYAYYNGVPVSATVSLTGAGTTQWVTLVWQAPGAASYTFSLILIPQSGDLYTPNNSLPLVVTNQPTKVV